MAWKFDASGDSLKRALSLPSSTNFTACGWAMKTVDTTAYQNFFAIENGTTNFIQFGWTGDSDTAIPDKLAFAYDAASNGSVAQGIQPALRQWFFWAVQRAGTGAGLLKSFVRLLHHRRLDVVQNVVVGASAFTPTAMTFGNDNFSEFWTGRLAGIKVWDAILKTSELLRESYQLAPVRLSNLHLWVPGDRGVADFSGRSKTLTTAGTITIEPNPPIPLYLPKRMTVSAPAGGVLAGQADILFGAGASTLTGDGALAGSSAILFGATDTLSGAGQLAGTATITFDAQGVLQGAGTLAGAASITFGGVDALFGAGALAGAAAITFGGTAAPDLASSPIDGSASITFTGTGVLQGVGTLAGVASISFGGQAAPDGASPVVASSNLTKHVLRRGSLQGKVMRRG